jgi:hypothetical protein
MPPKGLSRSKTVLDETLKTLDPHSERYRVLSVARDFKAAWVDLAEKLVSVLHANVYETWGYPSFEHYCRTELKLKPETAHKLTRSYAYVREHQPDALLRREHVEMPPLDVVDMLSRAGERTRVPQEALSGIHARVFSAEQAPPTKAGVLKEMRQHDPDAFKPAQVSKAQPLPEDLRKALLLSERLRVLLTQELQMPEEVGSLSEQLAHAVKQMCEQAMREGAA